MKKNVKILGAAAAAALLAVAPIAAAAAPVANAATVYGQGGNNENNTNSTMNVSFTANNVSSLKAGMDASAVTGNLEARLGNNLVDWTTVDGKNQAQVINRNDQPVNKLENGKTYFLRINVSFNKLGKGKYYNLNGLNGVGFGAHRDSALNNQQSGDNGSLAMTVWSAPFTVSNAKAYFAQWNAKATPQATYVRNGNHIVQATSVNIDFQNTIRGLMKEIYDQARPIETNGNNQPISGNWDNPASIQSIKDGLTNAGITAPAGVDDEFSAPAGNFTFTYRSEFQNGAVAEIPVTVNVENTAAPYFVANDSSVKRNTNHSFSLNIPVGSKFDPSDLVHAYNSKTEQADHGVMLSTRVISNNVNTSEPGTYKVVVEATTLSGQTGQATINVHVGTYTDKRTVSYVPGYNVYLWNINGNKATRTHSYLQNGDTVYTSGDPVTVDGVQYYKLNDGHYIQARYLGEAQGNHNTNKNGETKVNGVLTVTYNGRGEVRLLSTEGRYQNQYVKRGAKFRVWASKNINGRLMYRIGTQNQWIPAEFTSFSGR